MDDPSEDEPRPPPPLIRDHLAEIERLYAEEALTLQEIGDRFGVSRERIRQVMGKAGVHRGTSDASRQRSEQRYQEFLANVDVNEIIDRRLVGEKEPEIARSLGVHRVDVERLVEERIPKWRLRYAGIGGKTDERWPEYKASLRQAEKAVGTPLTKKKYSRWRDTFPPDRKPVSAEYFVLNFGSWARACNLAGVEPGKVIMGRVYTRDFSDDDIVNAVRACREDIGDMPTVRAYDDWARARKGLVPSSSTVRWRLAYSSWVDVLDRCFPGEVQ